MINVVSDRAHALVSVAISGHPTAETLENMKEKLEAQIDEGNATRLLIQVEHFCGTPRC